MFEPGRLGRVWCKLLTLVIDFAFQMSIYVIYFYLSVYGEQTHMVDKYKDFPF